MVAPRMSESAEAKRAEIVEELPRARSFSDPALGRVAECVALICGVDQAHVSIMEDETQCIVGGVGMEQETFDRDESICAHTIVENEVLVVEDATDDPRFSGNPHVQGASGLRFYVGLPIVIDGVPVGTLCALGSEPHELDYKVRSELFGAVNAVESHMRVTYRHGRTSTEYMISQNVTAARASATSARFAGEIEEACAEHVRHAEKNLRDCSEILEEDSDAARGLGFVDTDAEEE